jgi:hypothetical protein
MWIVPEIVPDFLGTVFDKLSHGCATLLSILDRVPLIDALASMTAQFHRLVLWQACMLGVRDKRTPQAVEHQPIILEFLFGASLRSIRPRCCDCGLASLIVENLSGLV